MRISFRLFVALLCFAGVTIHAAAADPSAGGKYEQLLFQHKVPEDKAQYGDFWEYGYYEATSYKGGQFPPGYWVYSKGIWYVWGKQNLAKVGFDMVEHTIQTKSGPVKLMFQFDKKNRAWAETNVKKIGQAILFFEAYSGIPYPGSNPYPIMERKNFGQLGLASPSQMMLASPPKGSTWTMMHEIVHIWNVGTRPSYVCEGLANFISYLLMTRNNFPFDKNDGYADWIKSWRERKSYEDFPLYESGNDAYNKVAQGKAMEFWGMAYELTGDAFIRETFKQCLTKSCTNDEIVRLLVKHGVKDGAKLMSGWVSKGKYLVLKTVDLGPVKNPLKGAWPK
jgi:hypothetical protein